MPSPPPPPPLTPELLERHGITYNENVIDSHDLNHINIVREGLLDFDNFLIRDIVRNVLVDPRCNHREIPESAFRDSENLEKWEEEVLLEFIKAAKKISYDTQQLKSGLRAEASWHYLFMGTVFKPRKDPRSSRSFAEQIFYVSDGTEQWNEAHSNRGLSEHHAQPTAPKPDFYFGFPIYDLKLHRNYGFMKADLFQNFTTRTLFHLNRKGLCPAPTSGFTTRMKERAEKNNSKAIAQHDLLCFPWAVVELKKFSEERNNRLTIDAYCQAANAGSTALRMLEDLTQFCDAKHNNQHIPPVVTVTCVGEKSKLWLIYSHPTSDSKRDHRMICIWEGSLSNIWDAIQFCRIADNVSFWAQDILKRQISGHISQWLAKFPITPQSEIQNFSHSLSPLSNSSSLVQSVTTVKEKITITTQEATLVETDNGAEQSKSTYAAIQKTSSHQAISKQAAENNSMLPSSLFGETIDRHVVVEPTISGLKSEATKSSPMLNQETKGFDGSTTLFKGSHQKSFCPIDNTATTTLNFEPIGPTPLQNSEGHCRSTAEFSYRLFTENPHHLASPTKKLLTDLTQPQDTGSGAKAITSSILSRGQNQTNSSSGISFDSQLASDVIFWGPRKTNPTIDSFLSMETKKLPSRNSSSRNPFISKLAGEGVSGKHNETQPSSKDPFAAFKQSAYIQRSLKGGKLTKPSMPESTMDFPIPQFKDLKISGTQDLKHFFGITQADNVGCSKTERMIIPAKTISLPDNGTTVLLPQNDKTGPRGGNTEELVIIPSPGLVNTTLRATDFPTGNNTAEETCESVTKRDYDALQQGDEIQSIDNTHFGENEHLSDILDLGQERNHVRLFSVEREGKKWPKLPNFITSEGSLNITFQGIELEIDNKEKMFSARNMTSNENDDEES